MEDDQLISLTGLQGLPITPQPEQITVKRPRSELDDRGTQTVPSNDRNTWYYPAHATESGEDEIPPGRTQGNWGRKHVRGARWIRKGKIAAWGPGMDDWETEDRARKRMRMLEPDQPRSVSPPSLPHLRSPSPLQRPHPGPMSQHLTYSSFVLDKSVAHTFRSHLVDDLERVTDGLVQAEAAMKQALGRLWQVMSEDPDRAPGELRRGGDVAIVPKREQDEDTLDDVDDDEDDEIERERARRIARAPDLTPPTFKLFLFTPQATTGGAAEQNGIDFEHSPFRSLPVDQQQETLSKSLAVLRELQDDGREYVERLEEIRDGLGDVRAKRSIVWETVRSKAIDELRDVAFGMAT